ncbi:MAG: GNA1162 family protein [Thermodesulfobacteriota bacterium]
MRRFSFLFGLLAWAVAWAGCMMPVLVPPNPGNPIKTVAVLPLVNETTDVGAPEMVREKMAEAMTLRHYAVLPLADTDRILRDRLGVTLGGQLDTAPLKVLRKELQVDGLVYGTLMDFSEKTIGIYNEKKVRARFSLVETATGRTVWQNGIGVKTQERMAGAAGAIADIASNLNDSRDKDVPWIILASHTAQEEDARKLFAINMAVKLLSKATGTHLLYETSEMLKRILETFPAGPGVAAAFPALGAESALPVMPPCPAIGHMDLGKKNFTAVMTVAWESKTDGRSFSWEVPIAKAGQKIRMDMDYSKATGADIPPGAMAPMIMIYRGDQKASYTLYPDKKQYTVFPETEDKTFKKPQMTLEKVGTEKIDGHPCHKFKMRVTLEDGTVHEGFLWNAKDLGDMTIKTLMEQPEGTHTTLLKSIRLKTPPATLFDVPPDYTQTQVFVTPAANQPPEKKSRKNPQKAKEKK